jgi:hypothetical protein
MLWNLHAFAAGSKAIKMHEGLAGKFFVLTWAVQETRLVNTSFRRFFISDTTE